MAFAQGDALAFTQGLLLLPLRDEIEQRRFAPKGRNISALGNATISWVSKKGDFAC